MIRIGIVGCGAVTEHFHLPALSKVSGARVTALVDIRERRAHGLAARYNVPFGSMDYRDLLGKVNAALIALPNALHSTVAIDLLDQHIHVLCEKPMALTAHECDQMIAAAEKARVVLAIGLVRRLYPSMKAIKRLLESGWLGTVEGFDFEEGAPYSWPTSTGAPFDKSAAGGGVLIDMGSHTLDLLLWWLGDATIVEYADDNFGGVEANCRLSLALSDGVTGSVTLSRSHRLKNRLRIWGKRGWVEVAPHSYTGFTCYLPDLFGPREVKLEFGSTENERANSPTGLLPYMVEQWRGFLRAIR